MSSAALPSGRQDETGSAPVPELDGVRGVAILLVLLFHFQGSRPPWVPKFLTYPMILGWSGVDLFFVLSGFLITGILIETRGRPGYFTAFYARRVLRIFPLYLLAVFLCFRVGLPLAQRAGLPVASERALEPWYWLHVSNWRSAFGLDVPAVSHFWSLSIEEQFYLLWPIVVLAVPPKRLAAVCGAVAILSCGLRCAAFSRGVGVEALHRLTPFRIDALALGGLVAAVVRSPAMRHAARRWLRGLSLAAAAVLVPLLVAGRGATSPPMTTLGYGVFASLYACLVFAAFDGAGGASRLSAVLRSPLLRTLGKYSYALYVFHYPVSRYVALRVAGWSAGASDGERTALWLAGIVGGVGVSFGLALLSWNLVEKRFLALKKRFVVGVPEAGMA